MASLSLAQMLDLAIGTPEVGALNLRALHRLLLVMLGHLGMRDLPAQEPGHSPTAGSAQVTSTVTSGGQRKEKIEEKGSSISKDNPVSQDLLQDIDRMKAEQARMAEKVQVIVEALGLQDSGTQCAPTEPTVLDMDTQCGDTLGTTTLAVSPGTQATTPGMQPRTPSTLAATLGVQPVFPGTQANTTETQLGSPSTEAVMPVTQPKSPSLKTTTLGMQPGTPDTQSTTPETQPGYPGTQTPTSGMQPGSPSSQATTPEMQPGSPSTQTTIPEMQLGSPSTQATIPEMQPGSPSTQATIPEMQPGSPSTQATIPEMQPGSPSTQATIPEMQPGSPSTQATIPEMQSGTSSTQTTIPGVQPIPPRTQRDRAGVQLSPPHTKPSLPGTENIPTEATPDALETQVILDQVRQLGHLYTVLKEEVAQLEATKADQAELENLCLLFSEGDQEISNILTSLQGQVSSLQSLASDLQGQKEKIKQLEEVIGKLGAAGSEWSVDVSDQITRQLGSKLQELKQELGEQQDMTKAALEQVVTKTAEQLQQQLDKLPVMVESTGQQQAEGQAVCPVCSTDTGTQLGHLQSYKRLQELMDSLMSQQAAGKVSRQLPGRSQQDEEQLKNIQVSIVELQRDGKELSSATRSLMDELQQQEKHLKALSQCVERLQKEKADKEDLVLAMDKKADRAALAGTVSHSLLEATVERLEERIREVQSQRTGVEQGWLQSQPQLRELMDSKLDRLELVPFRQQLQEHGKIILEQLKERARVPEAAEAAAMKRKLLVRFHCLSCDRPCSVTVPGPHVVAVPSLPSLSPCLAGCPQIHLKQEPTQQHRTLRLM
ncbi:glutamine-rich protein 2 [Apus apus]|uniref:glutamine-rich protein 2 n=1 Tax=Apus apus TaxID=8895 RepID=UPI0021F8FB21|nr:glutamine-rich protein 2 [Apus apus]